MLVQTDPVYWTIGAAGPLPSINVRSEPNVAAPKFEAFWNRHRPVTPVGTFTTESAKATLAIAKTAKTKTIFFIILSFKKNNSSQVSLHYWVLLL